MYEWIIIHSQWKLAAQLAIELNDYSSILIIMDTVDDNPQIRVSHLLILSLDFLISFTFFSID